MEPEDWRFGRWCAREGVSVASTKVFGVDHFGRASYPSDQAWGWDEDWHFTFPHDVDGWLTVAEGAELSALAKGCDVLEIGSFMGRSTVCMARSAKHVLCIDPFDGRATSRPGDTMAAFLENLDKHGVRNRVEAIRGTSAECAEHVAGRRFDVAFVDGDHDAGAVLFDAGVARRSLKPGGLIAFHDYRTFPGEVDGRWDPGVTEAVDALLRDGYRLVKRVETLAVLEVAGG
jgi:hypothetical protein